MRRQRRTRTLKDDEPPPPNLYCPQIILQGINDHQLPRDLARYTASPPTSLLSTAGIDGLKQDAIASFYQGRFEKMPQKISNRTYIQITQIRTDQKNPQIYSGLAQIIFPIPRRPLH